MKKLFTLVALCLSVATFSFAQNQTKAERITPSERAEQSVDRLNETLVAQNEELKLTDQQRKELKQYYLTKYAPKLLGQPAPAKDGQPAAGQLPKAKKSDIKIKNLYEILTREQLSALHEAKKEKGAKAKAKN
ncbi:MAG: hypothetical protein MRY78_18220 [Saprospiraceae bacterium]|nr:hypothetical protein [Saprospiraceae bacterium]